jgi:hypothetical protein
MIPNVPIAVDSTLPFGAILSGGQAVAHSPAHVLLFVESEESV